MLLMPIDAAPPLLSITDCGELVEPTATAVNVTAPGDTLALGATPVPVSATVCGLFVAESLKVRMALRVPAPDGVKATVTVQLAEGLRLAPHVLPTTAKSVEYVPVIEVLMFEIAAAPLFRSVIV